MIAPDLETGIRHLRELVEQAATWWCRSPAPASPPNAAFPTSVRPAASGPRCGRSNSATSWPARRCGTKAGGGGSPWRSSSAAPSPAAATGRWRRSTRPARFRASSPRTSTICIRISGFAAEHVVELHGNTTYATCLDCAKRYELSWVKQSFAQTGGRSPECTVCDGYHQDRDGVVRPVDAGGGDAARPGTDRSRAICSSPSARRWWFGRRRAFRWLPSATARGSSSSIATRPSSTKSPISWCMTTSARRSRRSSRIDSLSKSYSQATHTPIAKTHLFLFHEGANVIFDEEIRGSVHQETIFRGNRASSWRRTNFPKGLGLGPQPVGDVSDETATVIELSGVIKWFDVSKGYGFIVPDNGGADILLHVTCLRRDGFQTAYEGARVVAEVLQRPKGYAVLPHPVDGRVDGDPSLDAAAGAHPRLGDADQRARAGDGEVVQPAARLRLPDPRRGHARTSSSTWRRCAASASPSCGPARPCWCGSGPARRA